MVVDRLQRPLRSLRVSVTDRCNLRCEYCMPEEDYRWLPRSEILTFQEMARLVDLFRSLGVDEVHLTGGEPLVRHDLPELVRMLAPRVPDLALTTNGLLLAGLAEALRTAGLRRITVSLDTLRPDRFLAMARRPRLGDVLAGLEAARRVGFSPLKINTVVMRGRNEDEIGDLVDLGERLEAEVRFIEYMDVGGATRWSPDRVFPREAILTAIAERFGPPVPVVVDEASPARRWMLPGGTVFGIIASTTAPFCRTCQRARITADGSLFHCLYATRGLDLRSLLRGGSSDEAIAARIADSWTTRADRGAEERLQLRDRGTFAGKEVLRADPHLEMHTRGG
jgi:GTP 3',8-cyclase